MVVTPLINEMIMQVTDKSNFAYPICLGVLSILV
jgi:hypothetical protein